MIRLNENVPTMQAQKLVINDIYSNKYAHVNQLSLLSIYLSNKLQMFAGERKYFQINLRIET